MTAGTVDLEPNPGKRLDIEVGGRTYRRYPLRTKVITAGDDLAGVVAQRLGEFFPLLRDGGEGHRAVLGRPWWLYVSEKVVAITQGRSFFLWEIRPGRWARLLSRFVVRTPYGIGLGSPWTMQLAIQEAGLARILLAAAVAAAGRVFGRRGLFYRVAGANVRAIDGPTSYSVYPSNVSAKLPPDDPSGFAERLSRTVRAASLPPEVVRAFRGTVVIDANDLGRNLLGHDTHQHAALLESVFADNPLGQDREQTPLCVVFS